MNRTALLYAAAVAAHAAARAATKQTMVCNGGEGPQGFQNPEWDPSPYWAAREVERQASLAEHDARLAIEAEIASRSDQQMASMTEGELLALRAAYAAMTRANIALVETFKQIDDWGEEDQEGLKPSNGPFFALWRADERAAAMDAAIERARDREAAARAAREERAAYLAAREEILRRVRAA